MEGKLNPDPERARSATREDISACLYEASEQVLAALLENPRLEEDHLCLLLERQDLPGTLLDTIGRKREWVLSYRVKLRLAVHPHTPRLLALRLARHLYLMDLVQVSLQPSVPAELRRLAEELIVARLPQLPLGQKLMLARRGSARVAGGLLAEGHEQVARIALDNGFLNEAQVLKVLSRERLPRPVVAAIARHPKWSHLYNVRVALVRHQMAPLDRVLAFLPDLTLRDLNELCDRATISADLRQYIRHEIVRRSRGPSRGLRPEPKASSRRVS